jgi:hypothetical protein
MGPQNAILVPAQCIRLWNFGDMPPNACLWPNSRTTERTGRSATNVFNTPGAIFTGSVSPNSLHKSTAYTYADPHIHYRAALVLGNRCLRFLRLCDAEEAAFLRDIEKLIPYGQFIDPTLLPLQLRN